MENTEIAKVTDTPASISYFKNKDSFEHLQRIAMMFSKSDLIPERFKNNPGNCIIAIEMAERMGASYLMVMQNLDIIKGKPGFSSQFLTACINACGKFSPLRYEEDGEDEGRCRAWAIDKENGEKLYSIWVSVKMAKAEGWFQKTGSKWQTMSALMLRYRAAAFFQRQFAPEIAMGFHTTEELIDITPIKPTKQDKEKERLLALINEAKSPEELKVLEIHLTDETREAYNAKAAELNAPKSESRKDKVHNLATQVKPE